VAEADHILVVFENSGAGRRALDEATAIADEHRARISVAIIVAYERRSRGCCRSVQWNEILDEIALEEVAIARDILGDREPPPRFTIVPDRGTGTVRELVAQLGCDLVVVPARRWAGRRSIRRLRGSLDVEVHAARARS